LADEQPTDQPASARQRWLLVGLVAIFAGPILIAWAYTAGYIGLEGISRTNRGNLINPPIDLRETAPTAALFAKANLEPGEWVLTYLNDGPCEVACRDILGKLTTIRSVLGYSGQRVRVIALSPGTPATDPEPTDAAHMLTDTGAHTALMAGLASRGGPFPKAQIVFIDWRRQLVMRYDDDTPSIDIKKDLNKLLRASRIR